MAYALGLPSELTALIQSMVDWDYETRGWRTEMQASCKSRQAVAANGTRIVHGCEFGNDNPLALFTIRHPSQQHVDTQGFEQFEAAFDWDEDDDGVIDVDSGRWEIYHRTAYKPTIVVNIPAKYLNGAKHFKPWAKLKALG